MLTEPSRSDCYRHIGDGMPLPGPFAIAAISLLWGTTYARDYSAMTIFAGGTLRIIAHHRSQVLPRAHGHLHYMCMPFTLWACCAVSYCDDHRRQISSLSNLTLHNLRIAF